eukprot:GILI01000242.1.p1 GENE.GILI01000242.1~~GILI01000242.1.p1  ORF type:complete len:267 (+),score=75.69 GILI01000242.1:123-923(+)
MMEKPPTSTMQPSLGDHILVKIVFHLAVVALAALTLCWLYMEQLHGLGSGDKNIKWADYFNWHPFLMTLAYGVCMAESLVAFRVLPVARPTQKLFHLVLHFLAIIFATAALVIVLDFHDKVKAANFYSVHSYVGISAFVLTWFQFLLGFVGFFWPKFSDNGRKNLSPWHVFLGKVTFVFGLAGLCTGMLQKQRFLSQPTVDQFATVLIIPNWWVILVLLVGGLVFLIQAPVESPAVTPKMVQREENYAVYAPDAHVNLLNVRYRQQ